MSTSPSLPERMTPILVTILAKEETKRDRDSNSNKEIFLFLFFSHLSKIYLISVENELQEKTIVQPTAAFIQPLENRIFFNILFAVQFVQSRQNLTNIGFL